jgi:hypothetical protein
MVFKSYRNHRPPNNTVQIRLAKKISCYLQVSQINDFRNTSGYSIWCIILTIELTPAKFEVDGDPCQQQALRVSQKNLRTHILGESQK